MLEHYLLSTKIKKAGSRIKEYQLRHYLSLRNKKTRRGIILMLKLLHIFYYYKNPTGSSGGINLFIKKT